MDNDQKVRKQLFILLGLTEKEATIYDLLLTHGELGSGVIERLSKLKKNTYTLLRSLQRKHLITVSSKEGKRVYVPAPPDQLSLILKEQKRAVLQTQSLLESALPELQQNYLDKIGKPIVRHYTGLMGLRAVFDEVYRDGKPEVIGCVGNESPDEKLHQEIMAKYKPLRIKNKIFARSISPDTPRARELKQTEKQDLKEKILIDSIKYPMPAELDTWDDKVALMSFARKDFAGIMIEHKDFAITIQSLVRLVIDLSKNSSK